ncbi:SPOR domain-containing protein [Sphingomonas sp.]|uniref:SPOR domain-containing protein n=1 Tax=Sphingomonas sp. TaxID=28214 RepID=UPI00184800C2|nr:SPOR domain-containing protein [Sphingomonas sp.]MBA3510912.1 SPOR domain-containing protein [Sphingomonas sp.]
MADGRAAYDPDRLPWLSDTRRRRRPNDSAWLLAWALVATMLVAGASYWMGMKSVAEPDAIDFGPLQRPAATVRLPEPAVVPPPVREVLPPPAPEVEPVAEPAPITIPKPEPPRAVKAESSSRAAPKAETSRRTTATSKTAPAARKARARSAPAKKKAATRRTAALRAWPAGQSAGAYGRMVRVGAFDNRRQAKQGWARIVRVYPGIRGLNAVVVPTPSLRNGRTFYRLQFGTTSQAHSTVLCQRMRIVGQSCVVVGLPPSRRGVRR